MAQEITIDTVGNALGQYCTRYGNKLNMDLKDNLEFDNFLPKVSCELAYQGIDVSGGRVLQPYQKAFTPNNQSNWSGHLNMLKVGKIDLTYDWLEIEKFMDKWACNKFEAGKAEQSWKFPRFMINNVIMPQFYEDVNEASVKGSFSAPTAETAGEYLDTWNGFGTYFADFVTQGLMSPIAIGALGDDTAVEQMKAACKQLPRKYRFKKGVVYMSKTQKLKYAENYETLFPRRPVNLTGQDNQYIKIDKFNKTIIGLDCLEGSNRIIFQFSNMPGMIVGMKQGMSAFPNLRFHVYDRELHVLGEFWRFYGFETLKHTFITDAA